MPWLNDGRFIPLRSSGVHCNECGLVFAKHWVPAPDENGKRVCRDCINKKFSPTTKGN